MAGASMKVDATNRDVIRTGKAAAGQPSSFRRRHPLGFRLVFHILLFSSIITLLVTIVQLFVDFRKDVITIEERIDQVKASHLRAITRSVWNLDNTQLETALNGILQLPDISGVFIIDETGDRLLTVGNDSPDRPVHRVWPLVHVNRKSQRFVLGSMNLVASLDGVYSRLHEKILWILGTQAVKTFLVSTFILFLFHMLVTRHLYGMAKHALALKLEKGGPVLTLNRRRSLAEEADELDHVVDAMNSMHARLVAELEEIRKAEAALQESEANFRNMLERANDAIMIATGPDRHDFVNESACRLLGHSKSELLSKGVREIVHPEERDRVAHRFGKRLAGERVPHRYATRLVNKRGEAVPVELTASLISWGGEPADAAIIRDFTERLRLESSLQRQTERAVAATRAKNEFLATMSHEIRTPMNVILGMSQQLQEGELSPEQRQHVELILRAGSGLTTILNDILELSKIEAGQFDLNEEPFNLKELLKNTVDIFSAKAREKGIGLSWHLSGGVPGQRLGDPQRLRQVLLNLVGNAIKFTDRGSVEVRVEPLEGETVRFSVIDTGIGIPDHQLELIFNSFTQADSTTSRRYGGTGLGLAISKRLVGLMEGHIWLNSEPGKGSRFFFDLTLRVTDERPAAVVPALGKPPARTGPERVAGAKTILLVDDSEDNRILIRTYLKKTGHRVVEAVDGEDAVEKYRLDPPGLVLMDIQMPILDGYEATRLIRRLEAETHLSRCPIIALTAHAMKNDVQAALAAGCDHHLAKPVNKMRFLEVVRDCFLAEEL